MSYARIHWANLIITLGGAAQIIGSQPRQMYNIDNQSTNAATDEWTSEKLELRNDNSSLI